MTNYNMKNVNFKEIVRKHLIETLKINDTTIISKNKFNYQYNDKRVAEAVFIKLKNFINVSRERMLIIFQKSLKDFVNDPHMEKMNISYKLNDVEVYRKEYDKNNYHNYSVKFDRIYSDIEQLRG